MARMTTPTLETANPSNSSKRQSGARHAYLSRNGVVIGSAEGLNETNGDDWQQPTRTPRVVTMRAQKTDQMFGYDTFQEEGAE